jgi:hypothetical protein
VSEPTSARTRDTAASHRALPYLTFAFCFSCAMGSVGSSGLLLARTHHAEQRRVKRAAGGGAEAAAASAPKDVARAQRERERAREGEHLH